MSQSSHPYAHTRRTLPLDGGREGIYYSLPELQKSGFPGIARLPLSLRVVLESLLRNCGTAGIAEADVERLANWQAANPSASEIPFMVSRIVLQDFTGVPLLVDLAAMRDAVKDLGDDPARIEPLVPVDLVVDHSVQVDRSGNAASFLGNLKIEFARNRERYEFLKWGQQAFETFSVVPPAIGIVHQVNLEYLARVVFSKDEDGQTVLYPDSLVGTDSHTTMINGLGIVGWGVGGIEAEAGMLGQPIAFRTPEVIGVHLTGEMAEGVTATDLTLRLTEILRAAKVVGKFVEFFGEGARSLTVADRAMIANMAPEYGATMGYFPVDEKSLEYLGATGRDEALVDRVRAYFKAQDMFGIPGAGDIDYTEVLELDMSTVRPSVAGPKRPQDRIDLPELKDAFLGLLQSPAAQGGYGKTGDALKRRVALKAGAHASVSDAISGGKNDPADPDASWSEKEMVTNRPANPSNGQASHAESTITHGSVLIAAITSCTNTSNPSVMLAAGLVAKNAIERGLNVPPYVKTSLAPGSRVVTEYLAETGLNTYLDQLGFNLVGYGCTTCIGNSGPLSDEIEAAIREGDLVTASVLSGNRNFEARVHSSIRANFLMSPPLVVAFALAGRVDINLETDPIGRDPEGRDVYLKDIWPSNEAIQEVVLKGLKPEMFREKYARINEANPEWNAIQVKGGQIYDWDESSTYIQNPPFFAGFSTKAEAVPEVSGMRALAILGDSVTTDHISPAGAIPEDGPAGRYLISKGVEKKDFNSFGARRGNDRIMTRGTFANVRIRNLMADGKEGGYTKVQPDGEIMPIFDACETYAERKIPLIVFGGVDYGMGSSRDWAAKGTRLLGVKAVVAKSFERIHRSNLIGMGVMPLCFRDGDGADTLKLDGSEIFSLKGLEQGIKPGMRVKLEIKRADGRCDEAELDLRIDTGIEVDYYLNGGILPYVLRRILGAQ